MRITLEQQIALERLSHALYQANEMVSWTTVRTDLLMETIQQTVERSLTTRELALYDAIKARREFTQEDLVHVDSFLAPQGPFKIQLIKPEAYKILGLRCAELDLQEMAQKYK